MLSYLFIIVSSLLGLYRCNIWDNLYSNLRSPQYELYTEFMLQLYNGDKEIIRILCSSDYNTIKISLLDEQLKKNLTIADLYLNFTGATASVDFEDKCLYKPVRAMEPINVLFLLSAYDLFTFFREDNKLHLYEYILVNPNGPSASNERNPLAALFDDIDKDAMAIFRVDSRYENLVDIDFKYNGIELQHLGTKVIPYGFNATYFTPKHECKLYDDSF
jgi:hypothetical protein